MRVVPGEGKYDFDHYTTAGLLNRITVRLEAQPRHKSTAGSCRDRFKQGLLITVDDLFKEFTVVRAIGNICLQDHALLQRMRSLETANQKMSLQDDLLRISVDASYLGYDGHWVSSECPSDPESAHPS
jgi:hypothetical protein